MIKCKICGHECKYRLIEHIQKTHKMNIDDYKHQYGEVVSEEYSQKISDKLKEKWKDPIYIENTKKSREWIYTDEELNNKRIESIKNYYKNGGETWNKGLTKENDERVANIGKFNRDNLIGRTKENYDYLKKHSELMSFLWKDSNLKKRREEIQNDIILNSEYKQKISKTLTEKILKGEINTFSSFNSGWYKEKFWYSSGLELDSMILMDKLGISWSKNDKIKIKYLKEGNEHYYIPDFILNINNTEYIIEMKGFDWDGDTDLKSEYAKKEYNNYYIFYSVNELNNFINETNRNEINKNDIDISGS